MSWRLGILLLTGNIVAILMILCTRKMQGSSENLQYQSLRPTADPKNFGGKTEKSIKKGTEPYTYTSNSIFKMFN